MATNLGDLPSLMPSPFGGIKGSYSSSFILPRSPEQCEEIIERLRLAIREQFGEELSIEVVLEYLRLRRLEAYQETLKNHLSHLRAPDIDGVLRVLGDDERLRQLGRGVSGNGSSGVTDEPVVSEAVKAAVSSERDIPHTKVGRKSASSKK